MPTFLERYNTSKDLEEEGVWVNFGDGIEVQLRRLNSQKSKDTRRRLEKPYGRAFRNQEMPDSLQEELLNKQMAEAIIVDWKGVPDPDNPDKQLRFTPENALRMMKEFPDFREDLLMASMERATFQKEEMKAAEKNS